MEAGLHGASISTQYTHNRSTALLESVGTTRASRYQKGKTRKGKTNLDLLEQELVSGSGICWAICKSAPHPRQPRQHPTTQFFTGRMPFLPSNQQRQSSEGHISRHTIIEHNIFCNIWKKLINYILQFPMPVMLLR